ncbi:bifunctional rhamnulose-1-phosphate aldolase/short-chain dehydrogenase [Rhodothermus marinus]|uniref:bifunctional rhamnulose-1-phosphate aldolase/short-chain dehydrogenase n=1 Tax=Rhodothermus marinus TaxID=29549 RepID=UPI0012BA39C7|nr:bifunctional rhamnulose-1-phosphate aldolase/short-chain dehydrogenase [Rhodothermus marinus]BBM68877.1 short chain dehydrogenase [Rhodothermus marinus]
METQMTFTFVENRWDDAVADQLDPLGRLVYRSNLLGSDWRITNTGGGNTSSKLIERDPITGEPVEVLWVKGSGGDLRTATRKNFASLYQQKLLALQEIYARMEPRGPKTPAEDAMVELFRHCVFNLNPCAPSIDTPLHSFIPYRHVDHTHPVPCIAIATAKDGPDLTREIYGDEVLWVDWQRPGFELGLKLQELCRRHPSARGAILGGHGLINWADDDKECYLLTLRLIDQAAQYLARFDRGIETFGGRKYPALSKAEREAALVEILPWLRGQLSQEKRVIATVEASENVLDFVNANRAPELAELGTSCPDHFLRTKIKPLYVDWNPTVESVEVLKERLQEGLERYRADYRAYYEAHRKPDSPPMRGADPTVVLIPGVGMIAWGKTKSESRVTAEFYKSAIEVMRGAESVSTYTALPRQEAFDIEYWALEEAKLRRMPPEKELARQIVVVVGAGSGIGRRVAERLVQEGAVVAALDLNGPAARETADRILEQVGMGIGVAGTGISACGDAIGLEVDMTDREAVRRALRSVILAYGGLDHLVITAGLYVPPPPTGEIPDARWDDTFRVNVTGPFIVADEARRIWEAQELPGSLVITTSVNAVVPKVGSMAYDTSKAAANHLVRELALALAPLVRVNGVAPATVVEGSAMFPRERVIASLLRYGIPFDENEDTETLRQRLADFYARRNLLKAPITLDDQAEAIFLLVSGRRLSKTTGQVLHVDGGIPEGFLR